MPLKPLTTWVPSTVYIDQSFRSRWAQLLDEERFRAETAVQVDDIVALGLFSRIAEKPVARQFFPELFSKSGPPIDSRVIIEFRAIVEHMQPQLFHSPPTYERFYSDTTELGRRIWAWGRNKLNLSGDMQGRKALLWCAIYCSLFIVLFINSSGL